MSQRSISSFFKTKEEKENNPPVSNVEDLKTQPKKRKMEEEVARDLEDEQLVVQKRRRLKQLPTDDQEVPIEESEEDIKEGTPLKEGFPLQKEVPVKREEAAEKEEVVKAEPLVKIPGKYHPVLDACWKLGEPVPYLALSQTFEQIQAESSRLKITEMLANLFRSIIALTPQDLLPTVYLSINKLAPEYVGLELGIGESILMKAICDATGKTMQHLKKMYNEMGDLGLVAQASRSTQRMIFAPQKLTIQSVYKKLKEIASMSGSSSQSKKKDLIQNLLVASKESESQYIIRSLQGKLRIGASEKTVLAALAHAVVLTPPSKELPPPILDISSKIPATTLAKRMEEANKTLCSVHSELPSYEVILPVLLNEGIEVLPQRCYLTPGIPVKPMLAQPTKGGIGEVFDRFSNMDFTCEFKYDGERAQIHYMGKEGTKIYSRNLENNTEKFPDVIQNLPSACNEHVESFIIDGEVVAFDRETGKILPFQILSTRARKTVQLSDIKVQVCLYAFDLLYLNGQSLLRHPLRERREKLYSSFKQVDGVFDFAVYKDLNDPEEIQSFLMDAVQKNCEGLMIKTLDKQATYEPSKRSYNWLKVKKDYIEGMGDSLDLVVIGAYMGRGKRTGVYGGYLLACYDDDAEQYQSICKIGTGFSDENLKEQFQFFKEHIVPGPRSYYSYGESVTPDVWFEPVQVWEVMAADLSLSPVHTAGVGLVDSVKGIALRFPRFLRVREDKSPEDATTGTQVAEMYKNQKINHSQNAKEEDEDY